MKTVIQYTSRDEREAILSSNHEKFLIEEQNIQEGNFMIFSDVKTTDEQLKEIRQNNLILMDAVATAFEEILALKATITGGI